MRDDEQIPAPEHDFARIADDMAIAANYVDQAIAEAVLDPSQIADLEDLYLRMTSAEQAIDGNAAAITSKADLIELTAAEGRITTAEEDISALEGVVTTKVDTVTFDALETRVTSAEDTLTALGDVASIRQVVTVARIVDRKADANAKTALEALLDADRERRDRVSAMATAQQEFTARIVDNAAAEASARQVLAARIGQAEASIATEQTARVAADAALSQSLSTISVAVDENEAAILAEAVARSDADGVLAQDLAAVQAMADSNTAAIQNEQTARIDADGALAQSIDSLSSAVATNAAAIQAEQSTRADADSALASSIASVQAKADENEAAIAAEATARVDADGVLAANLSSVQAKADDNEAAINAEVASRIDADGALAQSLQTVSASVDDLDASVTTVTQAVSTIEGSAAFTRTIVEADGSNPAMMSLLAGKDGSAIGFVADVIALGNEVDGIIAEVVRVEDGEARLNNALIRGLKVAPTAASEIYHEVLLKPLIFLGEDGDVIQYQDGDSYGSGAVPDRIEVDTSGLPALAAGESYDVRAINVTDTQFQVRAKKLTSAAGATQTSAAGTDKGSGTTPRWQTNKPTAADAYDGYYEFTFSARLLKSELEGGPGGQQTYLGTIALYGKSAGGAWKHLGFATLTATYSGGGIAPPYMDVTRTVTVQSSEDLGSGADHFGIQPQDASTINSFSRVRYVTQASGGETPIAQALRFTVYPPAP